MTYLSVIAAAGAAALIAASVQADVATGQPAGKRIHKPAASQSASGKGAHKGFRSGAEVHAFQMGVETPVDAKPGRATGKRRHMTRVAAAPS